MLLPNGHHFVEIFYAAARAGLIVVPLNWRLVADELAFLLRDSGATVVVFHSDHDAVVLDLLGRGKADDSGIDVSHWLRVGSNNPTWALDLEARVDRAPAGPLVVPTDASDRCSSCTRRAQPAYQRELSTPMTASSGPS